MKCFWLCAPSLLAWCIRLMPLRSLCVHRRPPAQQHLIIMHSRGLLNSIFITICQSRLVSQTLLHQFGVRHFYMFSAGYEIVCVFGASVLWCAENGCQNFAHQLNCFFLLLQVSVLCELGLSRVFNGFPGRRYACKLAFEAMADKYHENEQSARISWPPVVPEWDCGGDWCVGRNLIAWEAYSLQKLAVMLK